MPTPAGRKKALLARIFAARAYRSFVFLPMLMSVIGLLCAGAVILWGPLVEPFASVVLPRPDVQTSRSLLSTIAGSALTVLSLVYSLTLVVFTLAAGNISPRLLTRFAEDRLIQMAAGVLAGTFFYAIVMLQRVDVQAAPAASGGIALVWSVASITMLIVFIHKVSTRITIDEEIGRIGATLADHIDLVLEEASEEGPDDQEVEIDAIRPQGVRHTLAARRSGYVEAVDLEDLVAQAQAHDLFIEVAATPGQFVVEGCPLAEYVGDPQQDRASAAHAAVRRAFLIGRQRTPEADLDFSILLMVEIAQRALSPGINDGFTAIAAIDHLSAAFARILTRSAPSPLYRDAQDKPRVWCEIAKIDRLLASAYHPLRRESTKNVTVALRLVASLHRLATVTRKPYRIFLRRHIHLIAAEARVSDAHLEDREEMAAACQRALDILGNEGNSDNTR